MVKNTFGKNLHVIYTLILRNLKTVKYLRRVVRYYNDALTDHRAMMKNLDDKKIKLLHYIDLLNKWKDLKTVSESRKQYSESIVKALRQQLTDMHLIDNMVSLQIKHRRRSN